MTNNFSTSVKEMISKVEDLIRAGNLRRIIIKDENGETYIEIPLLIGAIVSIAAPFVSAIGIVAGFAANFTVEIIKKDNPNVVEIYEVNNTEE